MTGAKSALIICLAAGIFTAGYLANRNPAPVASASSDRRVLYYTCPMHPQYKSERAGDAPCCGMRLVPVYSGKGATGSDAVTSDGSGMVRVTPATQQLIGLRTDEVRHTSISHVLRTPGRIGPDETRMYRIIAAADGWIRSLGDNTTGTFVEKDQVLASYYTTNILAASQTLLYSAATNEQSQQSYLGSQRGPTNLNLQVAIDTLRSLGMADRQMDDIRKSRQATSEIYVYAPIGGFVLARNISPQQRFDKGAELYRIADLSHVWVIADIFEKDRDLLKPGTTATVRYNGRAFQARMSNVLPQLDPQTRVLKTRFELDNPGNALRPDFFVDVEMNVAMPAALTVPAGAVIDSGRHQAVYIDRGDGSFEPRAVETGWRVDDRVQILHGLASGERVVVSGNFLIDSESRMKLAASATPPTTETDKAVKDPVCGMEVHPNGPGVLRFENAGRAHFFCSENCKRAFAANAAKYLALKQRGPA